MARKESEKRSAVAGNRRSVSFPTLSDILEMRAEIEIIAISSLQYNVYDILSRKKPQRELNSKESEMEQITS